MGPVIKPVWLLDVDEVLNVEPPSRRHKPPYHVWPKEQWCRRSVRLANGDRYPVTIAEPVLQFIRDTHEQQWATIKWHTSWQHEVHTLAARFGLPQLALVDAPEFTSTSDPYLNQPVWWKLPAVWRELKRHPHVVWTDDEINQQLLTTQREALSKAGAQALVPTENIGLTPKHLRTLFTMFTGLVTDFRPEWRPTVG